MYNFFLNFYPFDFTAVARSGEVGFLYGYSEKPPHLVAFYDTLGIRPRGVRTVSWSNYSHQTDLVNCLTGPTFPLPATAE